MAKKEIPQAQFSLEALFQAYYDCRKHKRNTHQAIDFEFNLQQNMFELYQEILDGSYEIGKSICFIVTSPKPREVWAGAFRDRIVHHLIYNAIKDRFIARFIEDSYSCIPNRGTLKGATRSSEFSRRITRNYTQDAYFLKADISNFFNSIDKDILFEVICKQVSEPWLVDLIKKVLFHDPKNNVYMKSPPWLYKLLPKYKSLFNTHPKKGLPIGNLTSQFFSNVYMNELDQFVKHKLKCKFYCRYVDDMLLLHKDPKYLNWAYDEIDKFLRENLALCLNHKKKNLNLASRGFDFVGHVIKPQHMHLRTKTLKNAFCTINEWKSNPQRYTPLELVNFRNKINSYLGMLRHVSGYNLRKKICLKSISLFTHCDEDYTKIILTNYAQM